MKQTANDVLLVASEKGSSIVYTVTSGSNLILGDNVNIKTSTFNIDGNDLVISSPNAGDIRVENFSTIVAEDEGLTVTLPNGEQVLATELLTQLAGTDKANLIEPAAGPAGGDDGGFAQPTVPLDVYSPDEAISEVIDPFLLDVETEGGLEEDLIQTQTAPTPVPPANILDDADEAVTVTEDTGTLLVANLLTNTTNPDGGAESVTTVTGIQVTDGTGAPVAGYFATSVGSALPSIVSIISIYNPAGAHATLVINTDGTVVYTGANVFNDMAAGEQLLVGFDYNVTDTIDTVTSHFTLDVQGLNDRPDAGDDAYITQEDTTLTVAIPGILINDVDPDGDPLTTSLVSGVSDGTLTLNTDGSFTYVPNLNYNGFDSFVYRIDDGHGGTDTATVRIEVVPVNDAPDAVDDAYTTAEDTVLTIPASGVLMNDTDPENDPLSSILLTNPANGTVTLNADGSFSYTPNANYNGLDSFTYRAQDASGSSDTATVRITVTPVNDAPDAVDDLYNTGYNTPLVVIPNGVLGNDTDPENDPLTVTNFTQPANGTVSVNPDGSFTYTPNQYYVGTDTYTYTISDGNGGTDTANVFIYVEEGHENSSPDAIDDRYTTAEDTPLVVIPNGVLGNDTDPDGDPLTVTSYTQPTNGTVSVNPDGSFTYTPNANYNGADQYTYTISDGNGGTDTATVFIGVTPVNDAPDAVDDRYTTAEDVPLVILPAGVLANDTDPENDPLTGTSYTQPTNGTVSVNPDGSFTYTPNANYNGADQYTYTISDGNGGTDTATVFIGITPVNDAPDAIDDQYTTAEDTVLNVPVNGVLGNDTDPENDPLTVTSHTQPANGTVTVNPDGSLSYTPSANYNGADIFTYTISDGNGGVDTANVVIKVTPVNDAPDAVDDRYTTAEDVPLVINPNGVLGNDSDPDGDPLTVQSFTQPTNGIVSVNPDGSFTYTPNSNYNGADTFTYTITDGALTDTATVYIGITPVNDAPDAIDDAYTTAEDTVLIIPANGVLGNDTDPENDPLTVTTHTQPVNGTVTVNPDGSLSYTPNANYNGVDTFTYTISDGNGGTDTANVVIKVTPINDAPDAVDDRYTTAEDVPLVILPAGVLSNDTDPENDPLTVTSYTQPANGTVSVNADGSFTYTPNANYNGADQYTYTISDSNGGTDTATVFIGITPVNDAPDAVDDRYTTAEDVPLVILPAGVLSNDTDQDGDPLTVTSYTQPANGTVSVNPDGSFTYTPNADYNGADQYTYTISDGNGGTDTATVFIGITPVNDAPDAVDDRYTTDEDVPLVILPAGVLSNDTDPENDPLTVTSYTQPSNGTVSVNPDGSFTYTPNADYNGADQYTYTISDGNGGTDTATVFIDITPVADNILTDDDEVLMRSEGNGSVIMDHEFNSTTNPFPSLQEGVALNSVDVHGTDSYNMTAQFNTTATVNFVSEGAGYHNILGSYLINPMTGEIQNVQILSPNLSAQGSGGNLVSGDLLAQIDVPCAYELGFFLMGDGYDAINAMTGIDLANGTFEFRDSSGNPADAGGSDASLFYIPNGGGAAVDLSGIKTYHSNYNNLNQDGEEHTTSGTEGSALRIGFEDLWNLGDTDYEDAIFDVNFAPSAAGASDMVVNINLLDNTYNPDGPLPETVQSVDSIVFTDTSGNVLTGFIVTALPTPVGGVAAYTITNSIGVTATLTVLENGELTLLNPNNVFGESSGAGSTNMSVNYTVTDGLDTDPSTFMLRVCNREQDPNAVDDYYGTNEDVPLVILPAGILTNDSDPDGDTLTVDSFTQPTNGTVTVNPDGSFTYVPNADYNGFDSYTYVATDGNGNFDTATVFIDVNPINDAPDAIDDRYTTDEDVPLVINPNGVLGNDTDPDGDPLTVTSYTQPANGTVSVNPDGSFTYTPNADYNGSDQYTYTISDGNGGTDTATVFIGITPVADNILDDGDEYIYIHENADITAGQFNILDNTTNPDGPQPESVQSVNNVFIQANGAPVSGITITQTETVSTNGQAVFNLTDGTHTATITVLPNGEVLFNNSDNLFDNLDTGEIPYIHVEYTVTDGLDTNDSLARIKLRGDTDVQNILDDGDETVTRNESADVTVNANLLANTTNPDGPLPETVQSVDSIEFTDNAGNPLTGFTVTSGPIVGGMVGSYIITNSIGISATLVVLENGELNLNNPNNVFGEASGGYTNMSVNYTVTDGLDTDPSTFKLRVCNWEQDPNAVDDAYTTDEDVTLVINPTGILSNDSDPDGDTLTVDSYTQPTNGSVVVNPDGSFTYIPNADYNGADSYTYTVTDGNGNFDTATVRITVNPMPDNTDPDAVDDIYTTDEDVPLVVNPNGVLGNDTDPENDPLTVTSYTQPSNGSVTVNADGSFTYTPNANYNGLDSYTYTISDGNGGTDTATVRICIKADDDPIITGPSSLDVDETGLGLVISDNGTLTANFGNDGPGTFAATDASSFSFGGSVAGGSLTANGVPVVVTLSGNTYTGTAGTVVVFTLAIQGNGDYSYQQFIAMDHADATDPNDEMTFNFGFKAIDASGEEAASTLSVNVLDDAPVANNDHNLFTGNSTDGHVITGVNGGVGAVDDIGADEPGQVTSVTYNSTVYAVPAGGTVTINAAHGDLVMHNDGYYTYDLNGSSSGGGSFSLAPSSSDVAGTQDTFTKNGITISTMQSGQDLNWLSVPGADGIGIGGNKVYGNHEGINADFDTDVETVSVKIGDVGSNNVNGPFDVTVHFADGTSATQEFSVGVPTNYVSTLTFSGADFGAAGKLIDNVDLYSHTTTGASGTKISWVLVDVEGETSGSSGNDVFTYGIVDADGDPASATLTFEQDVPPQPNILTDGDEYIYVHENADIVAGQFNILDNTTNPDGPDPESVQSVNNVFIQSNGAPVSGITITQTESVAVDGRSVFELEDVAGLTATIIVQTDGEVLFVNDQGIFDHLNDGERPYIHVEYTVTDGLDTDPSLARIKITGETDVTNKLCDGDEYIYIYENESLPEGQFNILANSQNPDGPDPVSVQSVNNVFIQANGAPVSGITITQMQTLSADGQAVFNLTDGTHTATITVQPDGDVIFDNGDNLFDHLNTGDTPYIHVQYIVTDGLDIDNSLARIKIRGEDDIVNILDDEDECIDVYENESVAEGSFNILYNTDNPDGPDSATVQSVNNLEIQANGAPVNGITITQTQTLSADGVAVFILTDGTHTATVTVQEDGDVIFDNGDNLFDHLTDGENPDIHIEYTVTDGLDTNNSIACIKIEGKYDSTPSEADAHKTVWVPDTNSGAIVDPNANSSETAEFGFKLLIDKATDVDGDTLTYQMTSIPNANVGTVYYHNGSSWQAVSLATVLTDNQIENLRFVALDDDINGVTDNLLSYQVLENGTFEGTESSVTINSIVTEDYVLSRDISSNGPNTSGNTLNVVFTHNSEGEAKFASASNFDLTLRSDHFDPDGVIQGQGHGNNPNELEVVLYVDLDGDGVIDAEFQIFNFEHTNWVDSGLRTDAQGHISATGTNVVWETNMNSDNAIRIDGTSGETLTTYLAAEGGIDAGDKWDFAFNDDTPGVDQGRYAAVDIESSSAEKSLTINGGNGEDLIYGSEGADYLSGNDGIDTVFAGAGDDTIVTDLQDFKIDGGAGFDTLIIDSSANPLNLDVSADLTNVEGIDQIDLTNGYSGDDVSITASDIIRISDNGSLFVKGDSGDEVSATEFTVREPDTSNNGTVFAHYTNGSGSADLYVELGLMLNDTTVVEE